MYTHTIYIYIYTHTCIAQLDSLGPFGTFSKTFNPRLRKRDAQDLSWTSVRIEGNNHMRVLLSLQRQTSQKLTRASDTIHVACHVRARCAGSADLSCA